jgi:predicted transcriptional regulator
MMIKYVITELNKRKSEWDDFSKVTGISTKTIYRIANNKTDPVYSTVERLYLLLKQAA